MPSEYNWQQEFFVVNGSVSIRNNITMADIERYKGKEEGLQEIDDLFPIGEDMVLNFGKKQGEINMVLLVPKTESRSNQDEVTINKVMANRLKEPFLINTLSSHFNKRNANNIKRLKIRYDVFSYDTDELLMSGESEKISDSANKDHGVLDFTHTVPPSSCERGGRKVFMRSLGQIAAEVEPRFQLFDSDGVKRLKDIEHILVQPNDPRFPEIKNVMTLKEMMIFITPAQPEGVVEKIVMNKWRMKVVGFRPSDRFESRTGFPFQYVPHDYYEPCIHCNMDTDGYSLPVTLPAPIQPARPGVRKRNMSDFKTKITTKKAKMSQRNDSPEVEILSDSPSPSSTPSLLSPTLSSSDVPPLQEPSQRLQTYFLQRLNEPGPSVPSSPPAAPLSPSELIIDTSPSPAPAPSSLYTSSQSLDPESGKVSVIKSNLNARKSPVSGTPQHSNKKLIALLTSNKVMPVSSLKASKDPCQKEENSSDQTQTNSYTSPQDKMQSSSLSPTASFRPLPKLIPINRLEQTGNIEDKS